MHLLDGNALVALVVDDHVHHGPIRSWFDTGRPFATCPITQGTLLRLLLHNNVSAGDSLTVLRRLTDRTDHEFWADDVPYTDVDPTGVIGHRQVTDAYLAQLARTRDARLVTFDRGLAALHDDVTDWLDPTAS